MFSNTLPEFQKFLASRKLVPEKNVSYYGSWVSKFLSFSNRKPDASNSIILSEFLDYLKGQKDIAEWQIQQAQHALQLYIEHFLKNAPLISSINAIPHTKTSTYNSFISQSITKMREAIRIKHYSYRTERSYIDWVKRFFDYIITTKEILPLHFVQGQDDPFTRGRNSPRGQLNSDDIRNFLSHLAIRQNVSSSTQNQAFNALLFLFRDVLNIDVKELDKTVRAKRGPKLPVVLSIKEIQELFKHVEGKNLLILQLLYGSGLRLMELARLRVKDIDFGANLIFVSAGKQDKDRSTILPESVKYRLELHLQEVKKLHEKDIEKGFGEVYLPGMLARKYPNAGKEWGWQYVFPASNLSVDPRSGKIRRHHISERSIQNIVKNGVKKTDIVKHATVHTLRHSFATHLLMDGVNIREIQELLGHKNVETTMIYTHVLRDMTNVPRSPLDNLYAKKN